jgi:hypothetical protein
MNFTGKEVHSYFRGSDTNITTLLKYTNNNSVPKIMFVRNPYARLLSGYLDKVVRGPNPFIPGVNKTLSFKEFLQYLHERGPSRVNSHFRSLSEKCYLKYELKYNYYLKTEEIDVWYADIIRLLKLEDVASSGWNIKTDWFKSDDECFRKISGKSCHETKILIKQKNREVQNGLSHFITLRNSSHDSNAEAKIGIYYGPDEALLVTKMFASEFELFKYPVWSGVNYTSYLQLIKQ